jgi:hypothetical protein
MWLTALPPAPPTPITLMTVSGWGKFDSDKKHSVGKDKAGMPLDAPRLAPSTAEPIRLLAKGAHAKVRKRFKRKHL